MSFDFFGHLIGRARRRELEGRVKINITSIGKRLAVGAAAATLSAGATLAAGGNPASLITTNGLLHLVGVGVVAMIPAGAASAGILTPARPGGTSLAESLVQSAVSFAAAPAGKRQAQAAEADLKLKTLIGSQVTATLHEAITDYAPTLAAMAAEKLLSRTGQFAPGELAAAPDKPGELASAPETPGALAASPTPAAASAAAATDDAIAATGGNQ